MLKILENFNLRKTMTINEYFGLDEPNYNETIRESKTINVTYILKEDGFADIASINGDSVDEFYWQLEGPYHSYLDITEQVMDYIYEKLPWMEVDEYPITLNCNMTVDVRCDIIGYEKQYEDESGDFELDEDATLRSLHIDVHCDDDSIKIEESINANMKKTNESLLFRDNGAGLADKGYIFTLQELGKLYDEMKDSDPVVSEYKNFSEWMNDTIESGLLEIVDERAFDESLNEADESQTYRGYKIVFHPGYSVWTNMKNYYKVYAPQGHLVGGKATLEKAKEMIDNRIANKDESLKESADTSLNDNVKSWYLKAYPTDEVGQEIDNKLTFNGVIQVLNGGGEIYDFLADDSVIRERVFSELKDRLGVDYDMIYYTWLYPDDHQITISESTSGISDIPNWFKSLYYEAKEKYGNDKASQLRYITINSSDDHANTVKWLNRLRADESLNESKGLSDREIDNFSGRLLRGKLYSDLSDEERRLYEELSCRSMINSILAYTKIDWTGDRPSAKEIVDAQEKKYKNYLKEYIDFLGKDRVIELVQEQMDIIEDVDWDISTDSEGLSYNSIKYKESIDNSLDEKLIQSDSDKAFKKNVATEIKAGKDPKQAVAIAYSVKRKNESASTHTEKEKEVASDIEWYFSIPKKLTYKYLRTNNINLDEYENAMLDNYDEFIDKLANDIASNLWQVTDKKYSFTANENINESSQSRYIDQLTNSIWNLIPNDPQDDKGEFEWVMEHCLPWGDDEDYPEEKSELKAKLSKLTLKTLIHIGLKCENKFGYPFISDDVKRKNEAFENTNGDFKVTIAQMDDELEYYIDDGESIDIFVSLDDLKNKYSEGTINAEMRGWTRQDADKFIKKYSNLKDSIKNVAWEKFRDQYPDKLRHYNENNFAVKDVEILNYDIFPDGIKELSKKLGKILLPKPVKESSEIKRYSDVVPKEKRRYWYFTTHGIQPGSLPNDVNILEVRDGVNDKGTEGTFVLLDAILNTSELKHYDMKELAPKTECLGESLDISDEDFQQKLKNELQGKLQYHYKKLGYTQKEIEDYIMPVYKTEFRKGYGDDGENALFIWVGAEVDYEELEELANVLNKVIRKYDKEAYFEPETAGRLISVLWGDGTNESLNESDEEWHDTADREQIDEPDYIPDEMDRYEAIAHKTVYDSDGFTTDYTLYFDHDENNYFTVFGDNDLYGPEDSDHDWDFGPNEDEAFEWFEDYEGFVDDDDVDLELTDDDLEAGQWYE